MADVWGKYVEFCPTHMSIFVKDTMENVSTYEIISYMQLYVHIKEISGNSHPSRSLFHSPHDWVPIPPHWAHSLHVWGRQQPPPHASFSFSLSVVLSESGHEFYRPVSPSHLRQPRSHLRLQKHFQASVPVKEREKSK